MNEYLGKPNPASDLIPLVQFIVNVALLDTEGERKAKNGTIFNDEGINDRQRIIHEARNVLKGRYPRFYPDEEVLPEVVAKPSKKNVLEIPTDVRVHKTGMEVIIPGPDSVGGSY